MKKDVLKKLKKIQSLYDQIENELLELPNNYKDVIFNFHNEEFGLHYSSRWGLTAIDDIVENFDFIAERAENEI